MSNEYTPTTGEVREAVNEWVWSRRMWRPELSPSDGMEFDRWLAKHDAEKAWDEGADSAFYNPEIRGYVDYPDDNPYKVLP